MEKILDAFFEKLYRDNFKNLFKYAYRLTYEKNMAEEITQDAFTEAYRKIELLSKHENPAGWLYITVKNIARVYMREYMNLKRLLPLEEIAITAAHDECGDVLLRSFLNEEESQIIKKFYIEKKSLNEIAKEYDISLSACKMRLKRARDKFKEGYKTEK